MIVWKKDEIKHDHNQAQIPQVDGLGRNTRFWRHAQPLAYLKRFGSVTVLNGHIHQTIQKLGVLFDFLVQWTKHRVLTMAAYGKKLDSLATV